MGAHREPISFDEQLANATLDELWQQLTPQQRRYVELVVLQGKSLRSAALESGYSEGMANKGKYSESRTVRKVIAELLRRKFKELDISVERTLYEIGLVAFGDPRKFYAEDGSLLPIQELDADTAATLASFQEETAYEYFSPKERKPVGKIKKIKLWDKIAALTLLARYHKLLTDRVEAKVDICEGLAERVKEARERAVRENDARWHKEHATMPSGSAVGHPEAPVTAGKASGITGTSTGGSNDDNEGDILARLLGRA